MRDVAERAGVHQGGRALQGLQQVRRERVAQDHRHRPGAPDLLRGDRLAVAVVADDDPGQPVAQVPQRGRQRQDRHDLAGRGDVERRLARDPVHPPAEAEHHVAQGPVVDVEHPVPGDRVLRQPGGVALVEVVVQDRGEHVVRRGDGVEVAGQVQVELLHRHDLRPPAARRAALDPERRAHRGLADRDGGPASGPGHRLAQPDGRGGLALAERGRRDRGDDHVLGPGAVGEGVDRVEADLRHVAAVRFQQVGVQAHVGGHVGRCSHRGGLRDLQVVHGRSKGRRHSVVDTASSARVAGSGPGGVPSYATTLDRMRAACSDLR